MALKPELQEIVDEMEFDSDEDRTAFEKLMEGKAGAKIAAGYAKNKDYTTKTQALATARDALEKERKEFDEGQEYLTGQMSTYKTDMEKRLQDALDQVSASSLRGAALETKLRTLAAQYGEDPAELLADVKATRTEEKKAEGFNYDDDEFKKRVVSRDEFTRTGNAVFAFAPMLRDLEREYQRLFGKEFDGSMQELVTEASREVDARRARGQNIDLFGYMREKLDFTGQKTRNDETAKVKAEEDRKKWESDTREEIERNVRSELMAGNPAAARTPDKSNEWRTNLSADKRNQSKQAETKATPMDNFKRRQSIHQAYEERAAKSNAA